jgi:hypothetical protein
MPLRDIILKTLYASSQAKQNFVKAQVAWHYKKKNLEAKGVEIAKVRYGVFFSFNAPSVLSTFSTTGWHGESGQAKSGGHVTVDFESNAGHVVTEHVYRSNKAYKVCLKLYRKILHTQADIL